jgi:predicted acylesterase/phospholipase RssA
MTDPTSARETPGSLAGVYHPHHDAAAEARAPDWIGPDDAPIRALAFSGGTFDTAMQLGVIHALLVSQGKAPDVVVGTSAGAVHAVALAEVMQAGEDESEAARAAATVEEQERLYLGRVRARVGRFRQIFHGLREAPGKLLQAMELDTTQVAAQQPLEPLALPIHDEHEWRGRRRALRARAGIINLYNGLLELRVSVGTLVRGVRRMLGVRANMEVRSSWRRVFAVGGEVGLAWLMLGLNLARIAPLAAPLLLPLVGRWLPGDRGAAAGDLIFQSRFWSRAWRVASVGFFLTLLVHAWTSVSLVALLLPGAVPHLAQELWALSLSRPSPELTAKLLASSTLIVFLVLLAAGSVASFWRHRSWFRLRTLWSQSVNLLLAAAAGGALFWLVWGLGVTIAEARPGTTIDRGWFTAARIDHMSWHAVWTAIGSTIVLVVLAVLARRRGGFYIRNLLAQFDLADGLLPTHPLRQLLVEMFDPGYYGELHMDDVVERALRDIPRPTIKESAGKTIGEYTADARSPRIEVALAVADVQSGTVELLGRHVRVVDGLLAANARAPIFAPALIDGHLYIDGGNIAHEPTRPLLDLLRSRANPRSTVVQLYSVHALPISQDELPSRSKFSTLVDVVWRALQLQRFRDATLGRRLTELFTQVIPKEAGVRFRAGGKDYLRTWVNAIEPESPTEVTLELLRTNDPEKRRDLMARTVADGCRAALETMLRPSMDGQLDTMPCRRAVAEHLARHSPFARGRTTSSRVIAHLPGSCDESGPGLVEICRHCVLARGGQEAEGTRGAAPTSHAAADGRAMGGSAAAHGANAASARPEQKATLRVRKWKTLGPAWPHEWEAERGEPGTDPHFTAEQRRRSYNDESGRALHALAHGGAMVPAEATSEWPRRRHDEPGHARPLVSLLFSGGVFRGVHQMGVLNALSDVELKPDLIAGASVGSITAALVAHAFLADGVERRRQRIAELAATYLSLDRLILTDRFADFVRQLTLRAAATRFSLRQADRVFRRFDAASPSTFNDEARLVVAGIERLLYISPFELTALVKALRDRDVPRVAKLVRLYLVEWIERMGIGTEVLGSEPLALVITEHVLKPLLEGTRMPPASVPFDVFRERGGIYFLATVTNLTKGRLEVLGEQTVLGEERRASLLEGLLASSAFPGVFRPRRAHEVMPLTREEDLYIDGGVMDNLPLDAVAHFLFLESGKRLVAARPTFRGVPTPHLLFSASLEANPRRLSRDGLEGLCDNWPALWNRAQTLGYNKKLDAYAGVQRSVRAIHEQLEREREDGRSMAPELVPLDLEVVTVRPNWLCGTFAFHPMLGFRRTRQAASIAHGCASTLVQLGRIRADQRGRSWLPGWGIDERLLPSPQQVDESGTPFRALHPVGEGECWLRPGTMCPFAPTELARLDLKPQTTKELAEIHRLCGDPRTHESNNGGGP